MSNIPVKSEPLAEVSPRLMHFQGRSNQGRHHTNQGYPDFHEDSKQADDIPSTDSFDRSTRKTHHDSSSLQDQHEAGYSQYNPHENVKNSQRGLNNPSYNDDSGVGHSNYHSSQNQQQRQQDDISHEISIQGLSLQSESTEDVVRPRNNTVTPVAQPQSNTVERHRSGSQHAIPNHHLFRSTGNPPNRYSNPPTRQDNIHSRHSDPNVISRDVNEFGLDSPTYFPVDSRDTETSRRREKSHHRQSHEYSTHERMSYENQPTATMGESNTPLPSSAGHKHATSGSVHDQPLSSGANHPLSHNNRLQSGENDGERSMTTQQSYQQQQHHQQQQQQEGQRRRPPRKQFERGRVHAFRVNGSRFVIDARYMPIKPLGRGAYGIVCSATDLDFDIKVAIKRIPSAFRDIVDARRILRETQLLRSFNHPHIIGLCDVIDPGQEQLNDVYMVMELMETDLHKIIYSSNQLTDEHIQYLIYQTLRGLHYIHSHGVIHRDLKPSNLLLNQDCSLKICDFGLARIIGEQFDNSELTEYVVTRWYRAPEVMYSLQDYDYAIDVWAVGCIFAELLNRRPLFPGDDYIHQLHLMFSILGTPKSDDLSAITNTRALSYIQSLPHQEPVDFVAHFPTASPLALELLQAMLTLHPKKRINVIDALNHPFFKTIHEQYPPLEETNDIISLRAIDQCTSTEELRQLMLEMVKFYRPWYRQPSEHQDH